MTLKYHTSTYSSFVVTIALSCTVSEVNRILVENCDFFIPSPKVEPSEKTVTNTVEEIHSVGTINNVETSYFIQLKICYLMATFRCPSDFLIMS